MTDQDDLKVEVRAGDIVATSGGLQRRRAARFRLRFDAATMPAVSRPTRLSERAMDCDLRWPGPLAGLLMTLCLSSQLAIAQDVESPKDDIAAQIRAQGNACDQPQSATRDAQASKPDEQVWLLQCEGTRYRVRLIPDMAAQVERIDQ
jgi:hypothetical protein